jgi:hypothetical protein
MYLTMLTHVEEGNPNLVKGLVNFHKCLLLHTIISEILGFQSVGYKFVQHQVDPKSRGARKEEGGRGTREDGGEASEEGGGRREGGGRDRREGGGGGINIFSAGSNGSDKNYFFMVPMLLSFLTELPYNSEEELWEISLAREPRTKKIQR